jgi:hypothetical protein
MKFVVHSVTSVSCITIIISCYWARFLRFSISSSVGNWFMRQPVEWTLWYSLRIVGAYNDIVCSFNIWAEGDLRACLKRFIVGGSNYKSAEAPLTDFC